MNYSQVIRYPCVLIEDTPDYAFETELVQPSPGCLMTFVHIAVRRWSKSTYAAIDEMWKRIRPTLPPIVYASGQNVNDRKWEKFVTRFGFLPLTDAVCHDGGIRRIFLHISNLSDVRQFKHNQSIFGNGPLVGPAALPSEGL